MAKPAADNARMSIAGVGVPQIAADFNKFDAHKTAQFNIGYKVETADGEIYRYAHFSTDVNRGVLVSPDIDEIGVADSDNKLTASASVQNSGDNTAGSYYVEMGVSAIASVTANDYAGGKLVITDDTGEGYTYDILGNTAKGTPATDLVRVQLKQPIQVTLDSTSDASIIPSKYANLEIATTTDVLCAGVTCRTMDVSEQSFGWIQTKGRVGILQDGAIGVGGPIQLSDGTSGAVQLFGGAVASAVVASDFITEPILGYCIIDGDSTGHGMFQINLE